MTPPPPPTVCWCARHAQDPAHERDILPQPYRMISKVVTSVVDAAWDILKQHAAKPTVAQHRCARAILSVPACACLCVVCPPGTPVSRAVRGLQRDVAAGGPLCGLHVVHSSG